jgi:hypothetical protein
MSHKVREDYYLRQDRIVWGFTNQVPISIPYSWHRLYANEPIFGTINVSDENPIRDPSSLAERIRAQPDVTNFSPVEGAAVPLLTFDWEGINIDLFLHG